MKLFRSISLPGCLATLIVGLWLPVAGAAPLQTTSTRPTDAIWTLETLMANLAKTRSGEANFIETKTLASLKQPLISSGVLRYRYPDSMEKLIEKPRAERYVINGDSLETWRDGKLKRQIALSSYPALQTFVTAFIATIGGDLQTLRKYYTLQFSGSRGEWTLLMVPTDTELKRVTRLIEVRGSGAVINHFETIQPNNDRSVMRISPLG